MGYEVFSEGKELHYYNTSGELNFVTITEGCSGIYSVILFLSAFCSYAITEYKKFDLVLLNFCILGLLISYFANLLRMAIIIAVGIHTTPEMMFWVHSNVGWLIFLIWIAIFWNILVNFVDSNLEVKKNEIV